MKTRRRKKSDGLGRRLDDVSAAIEADPVTPVDEGASAGLSTGSALLNLAMTGDVSTGYSAGKYYLVVGDSGSGKTVLMLTALAEAVINPAFGEYRKIYDNVEDGMNLPIERWFNAEVANQIEAPATTESGEPKYSTTIEEFYYNLDAAADAGRPFIYILDSMDALTSESESEKFDDNRAKFEQGKESRGSYGDGKAKKNSEGLRLALNRLRKTGSILIIVCQTRDNLGFGFEKKIRSGGRALRFYATCEYWLNVTGRVTKTVRGKPRQVGTRASITFKKNRMVGTLHSVDLEILNDVGVDDLGACVDYLVDEGFWSKSGKNIDPKGIVRLSPMSRDRLIADIEAKKLTKEIHGLVSDCWTVIRRASESGRQNRYANPAD